MARRSDIPPRPGPAPNIPPPVTAPPPQTPLPGIQPPGMPPPPGQAMQPGGTEDERSAIDRLMAVLQDPVMGNLLMEQMAQNNARQIRQAALQQVVTASPVPLQGILGGVL